MKTREHFASTLGVDISSWYYMGGHFYATYDSDSVDYLLKILERSDSDYELIVKECAFEFSPNDNRQYLDTRIPFILELSKEYVEANGRSNVAGRVANFINHHLRAVERIFLQFGLPRFRLDRRPLLHRSAESEKWTRLEYAPWEIDYETIFSEHSLMGESGRGDIVSLITGHVENSDPAWNVFGDSIRHFREGSFRETVITCCSAVEILASPAVETWLSEQTVTGAKEYIESATRELGNPLKFEIFMKSINPKAFTIYEKTERENLLIGLKKLNTIRNKVIHKLYQPTEEEAREAIISGGLFLRALWIDSNPFFSKNIKRYD